MSEIGLFVSIVIALVGSVGGFAALMKVNADNSKTLSEGATSVVKLLRDQVSDLSERVDVVEEYSQAMEVWSGQVMTLLGKAVKVIPESKQEPFRIETESLERARPRRRKGAAK